MYQDREREMAGSGHDPMIRAIFLDLGNVLVPFDRSRFYHRISQYSSLSQMEIARRFTKSELHSLYESGKLSSQCFSGEMCALLEAKLTHEEFCDAWSSIFYRTSNVEPSFLLSLAKKHVLVLLSNTDEIHFTFLQRHFPLLQAFHHFALSCRIGAKKPKAEIYLAALDLAGAQPHEAFYADDVKEYVDAARAIGFHAAQVQSKNELVTAMCTHGITVSG